MEGLVRIHKAKATAVTVISPYWFFFPVSCFGLTCITESTHETIQTSRQPGTSYSRRSSGIKASPGKALPDTICDPWLVIAIGIFLLSKKGSIAQPQAQPSTYGSQQFIPSCPNPYFWASLTEKGKNISAPARNSLGKARAVPSSKLPLLMVDSGLIRTFPDNCFIAQEIHRLLLNCCGR